MEGLDFLDVGEPVLDPTPFLRSRFFIRRFSTPSIYIIQPALSKSVLSLVRIS